MNLKIAYISDERFPSVHTDTQQVMKTIDALGRQGAIVDFIQPRMARHVTLPAAARKRQICEYYNVEGNFNIKDILLWPASDLRIEKFTHGIAAPLKARLGKYDVVYTRNILPLLIAAGLRAPVLFETYRALPNTDPWAWKMVKRAIPSKRFVGISTHSEYSRQVMIDAGVAPDMIQAIPNGFDPRDFAALPDKQRTREKLQFTPDQKIICYTGHIREDKGVHSLLDLAEECPDIITLIVGGNDTEVSALDTVVKQRSLKNVRLVPQVPIKSVPEYLAVADVLVLPPSSIPLQRATVLPMKTFTYLASGRPILAPNLPDTKGVLENGRNCVTVEPDVPSKAAAALKQLIAQPDYAMQLANQAREDAKKFTWDGRARNLISFLERRLQKANPS
ncbi:MAG: glycosyltransferase [Deltaproteobacteria bacterium]|nr:glycosyltransferase [Deltaproteobacteria bacterium]MBN2670207.1 glycosyltransferase [Deltaproteobacteria bacterium]